MRRLDQQAVTMISPDLKLQYFIVHRNVSKYNVLLEKASLCDQIPSTKCFFLQLRACAKISVTHLTCLFAHFLRCENSYIALLCACFRA